MLTYVFILACLCWEWELLALTYDICSDVEIPQTRYYSIMQSGHCYGPALGFEYSSEIRTILAVVTETAIQKPLAPSAPQRYISRTGETQRKRINRIKE